MTTKTVIFLIIGILLGSVATYFIVPIVSQKQGATATSGKQLYSCGMHPEVISEEPGNCPICGMNLTPIQGTESGESKKEKGKILYWRAPMDPTEIYDKPGKSKMGMDLVPVYEGEEASGSGSITIDGAIQQNMNLRIAPVQRRDINRIIRAFGKVTYAENKEYSVNTKINGWIEKLYVNTTGHRVKKGQPLLEIYSPELVSTQEEYLLALKNLQEVKDSNIDNIRQSAQALLTSARSRLEYWDIPRDEIEKLKETKKIRRTILLRSPINGVVTRKTVLEGDKVMPGMDLFKIADLSTVWVEATIYESELPLVHEGQPAELELDYISGATLKGKVDFIYPYLDQKARAANVRMIFSNVNELLKPDMYATVKIFSKAASNALAIPTEAVIRSGLRKIVFVAKENGKFEPRAIKIGAESDDGYVQVVSGLFDNERVVTSGQFMLDSESQTREAIAKMRSARKQKKESQEMQMEQSESTPQGEEHKEMKMEKTEKSDQTLQPKQGQETETASKDNVMNAEQLYACSMHPDFITSDPNARCPECGMKLTPVSELKDQVNLDQAKFYTCSMHPDFVTTDANAKCPECGMKLEPKNK